MPSISHGPLNALHTADDKQQLPTIQYEICKSIPRTGTACAEVLQTLIVPWQLLQAGMSAWDWDAAFTQRRQGWLFLRVGLGSRAHIEGGQVGVFAGLQC